MENVYDLVIIGAGPAGLSSGLYGSRAKLNTLIIEKDKTGGQIVITHEVANYPGSVREATGPSLVARMVEQCDEFGAKRVKDTIESVELDGDIKVLKGQKGEYKAKAVIIATGASPRKMGCPGEKELTGKGVSYCATCDADFFEDFEVFVVGGGDSALEEAMYLTKFARKVTVVHRRQGFRCAKSVLEKAQANPKIEFLLDTVVEEVKGDGLLESIVFKNKINGETHEYFADEEDGTMGLFVFVGLISQTDVFKGKVNMNEQGYIITDQDMKTDIEGVFAAGDVREKSLRQVVTATGDGSIAAVVAEKYIDEKFPE
ncbi:thioredoxin-disulfide reductase [Metaclostridioides mangenotii]|uniref:thioredoxin-disulfide reductase n=1 Tax=Metaclostridioides mangenotii TaxID=1540 RepID=UPI0028EAA935|nr:thioredoxin-disulfide reductase [Clostridioides mangenotii]